MNYGLDNIKIYPHAQQLYVFIHKLHVLEIYIIDKYSIINQQRYELNHSIQTIAVGNNLLYFFYENCQAMDIIALEQ